MAILIIEDEFLVAAEIRFHLLRGGFIEVEHAATERDALVALDTRDWAAAVLDANLNGCGVERIAAMLAEKEVPFVIVTGYGQKSLPLVVAHAPVIDKPFKPEALVEAVTRLCARSGS